MGAKEEAGIPVRILLFRKEVMDRSSKVVGFRLYVEILHIYIYIYIFLFSFFCLVAKSLPGSSIHGISQARILEWVAIFSSRGSSSLSHQGKKRLTSKFLTCC